MTENQAKEMIKLLTEITKHLSDIEDRLISINTTTEETDPVIRNIMDFVEGINDSAKNIVKKV